MGVGGGGVAHSRHAGTQPELMSCAALRVGVQGCRGYRVLPHPALHSVGMRRARCLRACCWVRCEMWMAWPAPMGTAPKMGAPLFGYARC